MPGSSRKGGRELKVRVEGQVAFNDERLIIKAARAGLGLAYVFGDTLEEEFVERGADPRPRRVDSARSPAIISTIQAAASNRRLSLCWSRPFDIAAS